MYLLRHHKTQSVENLVYVIKYFSVLHLSWNKFWPLWVHAMQWFFAFWDKVIKKKSLTYNS